MRRSHLIAHILQRQKGRVQALLCGIEVNCLGSLRKTGRSVPARRAKSWKMHSKQHKMYHNLTYLAKFGIPNRSKTHFVLSKQPKNPSFFASQELPQALSQPPPAPRVPHLFPPVLRNFSRHPEPRINESRRARENLTTEKQPPKRFLP